MDYIPSIHTESPDPKLLKYVNALIDSELSRQDTSKLHPSLEPSQRENNTLLPLSSEGMQMPKLSDKYTNSKDIDYQLLASYSQLRYIRDQSLNSIITNTQSLDNLLILENIDIQNNLNQLESNLSAKRFAVEELKSERSKKIKSFKPINDFLLNRWTEKINQLVDIQINKLQE